MQTFLPYADFEKSAQILDFKRLGKQRVENYQLVMGLLRVNADGSPKTALRTWGDHIVGKMWANYLGALVRYQRAVCRQWMHRGYKDTCLSKTLLAFDYAVALDLGLSVQEAQVARAHGDIGPLPNANPPWLGDERFHRSHQSNLVRKDPEYYRKFFPEIPDDLPYVWPVH